VDKRRRTFQKQTKHLRNLLQFKTKVIDHSSIIDGILKEDSKQNATVGFEFKKAKSGLYSCQ
jgi:hypothetical protein